MQISGVDINCRLRIILYHGIAFNTVSSHNAFCIRTCTANSIIHRSIPLYHQQAVWFSETSLLLWDLFCKVADDEYMKKKTPDMPINHRRCIWLSNPAWLSQEYAKIKAVEAKKVADEAAKILSCVAPATLLSFTFTQFQRTLQVIQIQRRWRRQTSKGCFGVCGTSCGD